jgi:hypothetical protein
MMTLSGEKKSDASHWRGVIARLFLVKLGGTCFRQFFVKLRLVNVIIKVEPWEGFVSVARRDLPNSKFYLGGW